MGLLLLAAGLLLLVAGLFTTGLLVARLRLLKAELWLLISGLRPLMARLRLLEAGLRLLAAGLRLLVVGLRLLVVGLLSTGTSVNRKRVFLPFTSWCVRVTASNLVRLSRWRSSSWEVCPMGVAATIVEVYKVGGNSLGHPVGRLSVYIRVHADSCVWNNSSSLWFRSVRKL